MIAAVEPPETMPMSPLHRRLHVLLVRCGATATAGLDRKLAAIGFEISVRSDAAGSLDVCVRRELDGVVVNISGTGDEGLEDVSRLGVATPAPVVTVGGSADKRRRAFDHGAVVALPRGVLVPDLESQLLALVRLYRRPLATVPSASALSTGRPEGYAPSVPEPGDFADPNWSRMVRANLTTLEWKLLTVLSAEPGRYFTSRELLELVWGYTTGPVTTVSVHIHRLRRKLDAHGGRAGFVETVRGRGYAFRPPEVHHHGQTPTIGFDPPTDGSDRLRATGRYLLRQTSGATRPS